MSAKRQYSLPNCNLILEGVEDASAENVNILDGQSPMSILINAECNFLNSNQKLSGGSVFLENLSRAVSIYAQGFLSGLSQPHSVESEYPHVSITQDAEQHLHRLIFEPEPDTGEAKTEVNLTTVELFDLVDAIDQLYADNTTLPDMNLEIQSISKRYRQPEQPLAERLTPVAVGLTSLAIAAGAFFIIPPPEIDRPEPNPVNPTTETESDPKSKSSPQPESTEKPNTNTAPESN